MSEEATYLKISDALKRAEEKYGMTVTDATMRKWAWKHRIGHQTGTGRWLIDQTKLDELMLEGQMENG